MDSRFVAGKQHFRNGLRFIKNGGLGKFVNLAGMTKIDSYDLSLLSCRLIVA